MLSSASGEHPPGGTRNLTTRCPEKGFKRTWLDLHHHPMSSIVTEKYIKKFSKMQTIETE